LAGSRSLARDIRALSTARADSCPRSDYPAARPRLALPVRQGESCVVSYRTFTVETALYFCGCEAKLGNSQIRRF